MKLWQRVYLVALVIITFVVNVGFFGIIYFTYNHMLQEEKNRCNAEFVILRENVSADIAQMEKSIPLNKEYFGKFITAYNSYYEAGTVLLGVVDNEVVGGDKIYDKLPRENGVYIENEGQTTIYVSQILDDNHQNYRIIMKRTLDDFDKSWDTLRPLYIVGGIVLSLVVSLLLSVFVRIVLKPMDELEEATKKVQAGDWSARVHIKGNHELAQLGNQFNAMAGYVEENITKLQKMSDEKQELINNLAHEMNTPITSIQGFADYMRMGELSVDEQNECLGYIAAEGKRLKEISATLLYMAKMQNPEDVTKTSFSIENMCNRLESIYKKEFAKQNVKLQISCEVQHVQANETLIESLLRNLITNGYHAVSDRENALVEVRIFAENDVLNIQITDNGCGIEEEHISHIFEPFYRVDKARSREMGGSGLGLPFCKKIVDIHNGSIEVESRFNHGTTFLINLPFDNLSESI